MDGLGLLYTWCDICFVLAHPRQCFLSLLRALLKKWNGCKPRAKQYFRKAGEKGRSSSETIQVWHFFVGTLSCHHVDYITFEVTLLNGSGMRKEVVL